ncbi:MAG: RdgB/HAM1 family non-canonical purine NTP pyrophosphatase [Betaproteobacteria bacterium]|nr:RdgB/HAM1 family non-canonical purine NTP pyrophosphatase [Betaproteobacteria bacterium]
MKKIVIASNNVGKLNEIGAILVPLDIEIVPQSTLGVPEADEPHFTFVENALAKARHASRHSGLPALADDSGICVDALNGAPGVHSARFAGDPPAGVAGGRNNQDERNNRKLLELLANETNCKAHYYCVIVLTRHADDPQPLICEAEWHGEIVKTPRGGGGFGYDPLFLIPELRRTAAELTPEHKNRVSHRGQALAALAARLRAERGEERRGRREGRGERGEE